MGVFWSRGPLPPDSSLFRGRVVELQSLVQLCREEVKAYHIVYGGRQIGKTSLLIRLASQLPADIKCCRVDFQQLPSATTLQVFKHLAQSLVENVCPQESAADVTDAPRLTDFLRRVISRLEASRLVLILEELGALPQPVREDLANVLRAIFNHRFDHPGRPLAKLMVILSGGIELYDLAVTQVSTLHNICEFIYLGDLDFGEAVGLVADTLVSLEFKRADADVLGQAIYSKVKGHPYFTQRLGSMLEDRREAGQALLLMRLEQSVEQLHVDDVLLRNLREGVNEQQLFPAGRSLLEGRVRFSRMDSEMSRLELLGLAVEANGYWVARNPLLARALREWLGASANLGNSQTPSGDPKVIVYGDANVTFGDRTQIEQTSMPSPEIETRLDEIENTMQSGFSDLKRGQTAIYQRIDGAYREPLARILNEVRLGRIEQGEMTRTLDAIRRALRFIQLAEVDLKAELREAITGVASAVESNLSLQHKLELSLPIIPLFLDYKVELAAGSEVDLNEVKAEIGKRWEELVTQLQQ